MKNQNLFVLLSISILFITSKLSAQEKWVVDKTHSNVKFTVKHLLVSEVEGSFRIFTGSFTSPGPDLTNAVIEFSVDVSSINTDNEMRDNHLRSDDFFNAEKFPKMTFTSKSIRKNTDGKYLLTGDLTIRDITKRVTFDVTYLGKATDMRGGEVAGFIATSTINRLDYNLKWNKLTEAGGAVVGPDVRIQLNLEFRHDKDS